MDIEPHLIRLFGLKSAAQLSQSGEVFNEGGYLSYRKQISVTKNDSEVVHLFIKSSDTSRTELAQMQTLSNYFCRTECIFYGLMAPVLERVMLQYEITPMFVRTYCQKITDNGTLLVMEDMTKQGFSPVDRISFSIDQTYCVLRTLARLQAAYWIARTSFNHALDSVLFGTESPFSDGLRKSGVDLSPMMVRGTEFFFENLPKYAKTPEDEAVIRDCILSFVNAMVADPMKSLPTIAGKPIGLAHGDLWFANFMFKGEGDSMSCRLYDWQFWDVSLFGFDLGLIMMTSLPNEVMQEHVDQIPVVFYQTFKETFEAKTGRAAPFSEAEALSNMGDSLCFAMIWVVTTCYLLWDSGNIDVPSMLANLAFAIRTKRIAMPFKS